LDLFGFGLFGFGLGYFLVWLMMNDEMNDEL